MSSIYEQAVIRAQLSIVSTPPVSPIDVNTGDAPRFWRGSGIEIDVGIFDGSSVGLDLSNLYSLTLNLQPGPTSPVPWVTKTVVAADISSPINYGDWLNGLTQNAKFILSAADTDVGLLAQPSRQFWLTVTGVTTSGAIIVYGAGYVTLYNPGYTLSPPSSLFALHAQSNNGGNSTVTPTGILHTEELTFGGSAGTRNIILAAVGFTAGAVVRLLALLPNLTPGIIIKVYSAAITGSPIFTFTTDDSTPNVLFEAVANTAGGYDPVAQTAAAYTPIP
jgi:hypothetical protein